MHLLIAAVLAATLIDGVSPPKAASPHCDIAYALAPGQRLVETCDISRLHARRGQVQIQTNT